MPSIRAVLALATAIRARRREQWLTAAELRERRTVRLRRLAALAARSPYWKAVFERHRVHPDGLDEDGLERLPILEKAALQAHFDAMVTAPRSRLFQVRTSGSTGIPVSVYRTERDQAEVSALHTRIFAAFGRRPLDRQVSIGSGQPVASKGPVAALRRAGVLPPMHRLASFEPLASQVETLRRIRPDTLNGYAVALELLAEAVIEAGVTDIRPRLVYTGSMATTERCRRLVEEAFGVRPFDVYATIETGPISWECPESPGDYHLNDDVQVVEIVDERGRRLPDGETGEVVITSLTGTSQPLFRYRVGDFAARRPHPCRCGRGLALMGQVEGRTKHVVRTADGRVLNSAMLGSCFSPFPEVRRWQAHQTAPAALRVLLMTTGEWTEKTRAAVMDKVRAKLGDALHFEIVTVEEIPLAPTGKFQTIVPLPEG